ncbi:hypothetical protein WJX82_002508 [Trebouxia sp. C0006]
MFSEKDTGTRRLLELGIRQKLRRPLHWTHSFMIALSILSPTTCITGLFSQGLIYGGPVVLVWGWVCAGSLHTLAAFSMSELSSAFPVSGGLYYWSFMLGGNHGPFASWMVGWINLLGQVAIVAGSTFVFVEILAACLFLVTRDLNDNGYYPSSGMQLYIYAGVLAVCATINSAPLKVLVRVAKIGAVWQVLGTFTMVAFMLALTPKQQKWVWVLTDFRSAGSYGITSNVYTVLVGLSGASWPLMGYDSVAHMMEETRSADTTAGKPMPYTLVASFLIGLVYLLALTLCIQDVQSIVDPSGSLVNVNSVALILWDIFDARYGSGVGAVLLLLLPLGCSFFCAIHTVTSASRMLYGFSRDQAVPFWRIWQTVDDHGVPVHAVWGMTFAVFLLGLPMLGGATAFDTASSIATAGLCLAYALPIGFRIVFAHHSFEPGPFSLGRWSVTNAVVACIWLLFASAIFMLPQAFPVSVTNNNYTSTAVGSILLAALTAWLVSARHWFSGPRIDVDNSDAVRVKYWVTDPPRKDL